MLVCVLRTVTFAFDSVVWYGWVGLVLVDIVWFWVFVCLLVLLRWVCVCWLHCWCLNLGCFVCLGFAIGVHLLFVCFVLVWLFIVLFWVLNSVAYFIKCELVWCFICFDYFALLCWFMLFCCIVGWCAWLFTLIVGWCSMFVFWYLGVVDLWVCWLIWVVWFCVLLLFDLGLVVTLRCLDVCYLWCIWLCFSCLYLIIVWLLLVMLVLSCSYCFVFWCFCYVIGAYWFVAYLLFVILAFVCGYNSVVSFFSLSMYLCG